MNTRKRKALLIAAIAQPLSALYNHTDINGLERQLFCSGLLHKSAPFHIAVHNFDGTYLNKSPGHFAYTQPHAHNVLEINLVIPKSRGFAFQLETDGKVQIIRSATTIIIPPGVKHRMEVIRGRGMMICIVCSSNYAKSFVKANKRKQRS